MAVVGCTQSVPGRWWSLGEGHVSPQLASALVQQVLSKLLVFFFLASLALVPGLWLGAHYGYPSPTRV